MKNIILITSLFLLLINSLHALHGKIVFYDGTYVVGKVTKVDESSVYIVPIGLDTAEGVLVGNIDSLKMENGMVPVVSSAVNYFYQNGQFIANNNDWMDEYDDFKYDDYALIQEEYKYNDIKKTYQQYFQISGSLGYPVLAANSLKENEQHTGPSERIYPNLSLSFQFPYYPIGALDISPGIRLMNFGWENSFMGQWKCLQAAAFASIDFKPILYFLPDGIHPSVDVGLSYNIAFDYDQSQYFSVIQPALPGQEYGGIGFNSGLSIDYWMKEIPIALKLYGNGYFLPQPPPYHEQKTMFGSVGISLVLVLKRH
ncbi:MAG: hypothetical protein VXA26_05730 [Candidatus Neomarinimicrobiota bacterium]